MDFKLMYTIAIILGFIVFDLYNKRNIPIAFMVISGIGALFLSNNLTIGLIELLMMLALGLGLMQIGIGYADSVEIGILSLINPILVGVYSIPLVIPLFMLSILLAVAFTVFIWRKGGQPATLAIGLARLLLLIV